MSAVLRDDDAPALLPLTVNQLEAVLAIEVDVYPFPWTRGNF
ncbi:MAG: ribosomal-protein-alanine N-acetyltransferase, partial [Betaproteobacteria bacterium]